MENRKKHFQNGSFLSKLRKLVPLFTRGKLVKWRAEILMFTLSCLVIGVGKTPEYREVRDKHNYFLISHEHQTI